MILREARYRELSRAQKKELKQLYVTAFPKAERVPWRRLIRLDRRERCEFSGRYDGERLAGLTVVIEREDFTYLFFLAVSASARGKGYGSAILRQLSARYDGKPLVLDMEKIEPSPNLEERVRRKNFYLKNGFSCGEFGYEYRGVRYETMFRGETFPEESYRKFLPKRIREFYN